MPYLNILNKGHFADRPYNQTCCKHDLIKRELFEQSCKY